MVTFLGVIPSESLLVLDRTFRCQSGHVTHRAADCGSRGETNEMSDGSVG